MSIVEETSKVTQQAITALNSVPVLLALVMLQFFILGSLLYLSVKRDNFTHIRFLTLIERCVTDPNKKAALQEGIAAVKEDLP
jgi:hypothetical protein